ncbi:hypothetical protein CCHOA_11090 [Corynebacterium choanae]|uniref:Uncharacterized protein n=1 Tax=Corynebacterium choanae TaxID=1862358 RepID=A0A3G6J8Z7_9CORY|nr:hypothetical protein CCHOA_11090 [Corynebacterium choanae]
MCCFALCIRDVSVLRWLSACSWQIEALTGSAVVLWGFAGVLVGIVSCRGRNLAGFTWGVAVFFGALLGAMSAPRGADCR